MVCGSIVGFAPQVMSVRMMSSIYGSMTVSVCSRFFDIDLSALEGITLVAAITLIVVSALLFSAEIGLSLKALGLAISHLPQVEDEK